jgi:hypothetical protein
MTENDPTPGETLEEMLERVIFTDPVTRRLRDEWGATKREVQHLFESACRERYEDLLEFHQICHPRIPQARFGVADPTAPVLLLSSTTSRSE